jgi:hypothetical protein
VAVEYCYPVEEVDWQALCLQLLVVRAGEVVEAHLEEVLFLVAGVVEILAAVEGAVLDQVLVCLW